MPDHVTERQGLDLKIKSTVQFEFGSLCDLVDKYVESKVLTHEQGLSLKRAIRMRGNNIINVVSNHLDFCEISRNHRKDTVNIERVVGRAIQKG